MRKGDSNNGTRGVHKGSGGTAATVVLPVFQPRSNMTESFAELFEQSQKHLNNIRPGSIVSGIVVDIRPDVVVINAGLKSEGVVPIEQFRGADGGLEVKIGDEVKVAVEAIEDGTGETRLSREKAKRAMVWEELPSGPSSAGRS